MGTLPIESSTKPKKAAVEARSVLSCMQAKVTRRTRNQEEDGHPTKLPSQWCAMFKKLGCVCRFFLILCQKSWYGPSSERHKILEHSFPTAEHFIKIREKHCLCFNVIQKGSAMKEALGHLHTNSVMRILRCGQKNSRDAKRGTGPKGYTKFAETSGKTKRHSSEQNWNERLLRTLIV